MLKPYELLENVLLEIEKGIRDDINADMLAEKFYLSSVHLQRLFKFSFGRTIGSYIRSRRLSASIGDLLKTNFSVLDIAIEYGFEYEETYIKAFKKEFCITPGSLRKTGEVVKITPPMHLFDAKKSVDGVFFGPDIVMVPQFHIIGRLHHVSGGDIAALTPEMAFKFWDEDRLLIKTELAPNDIYVGFARNYNFGAGTMDYMPSVPVKDLKNIPQGLCGDTFESSLCARFRYIGQHHYFDLNRERMQPMYNEIYKFRTNEQEKYTLSNDKVYFEKIDLREVDINKYDGTYCKMEWFAPVAEKNEK